MDWNHFNVHLAWPDKQYEKLCVTALSKDDAICDTRIKQSILAGAYPVKVTGPLGVHLRTPKQHMAGTYAWVLGNITSAQATLNRQALKYPTINANFDKIDRAKALVDAQFAKLQRDIKDLFRTAGLKVK